MSRACDSCGSLYEPLRRTSRYCSGRCRKRAQRSGLARPAATDQAAPSRSTKARLGTLTAAVLAELREAKKETSALGQACINLATRLDTMGHLESGAAYSALMREFRATREAALKVTGPAGDVLDELAKARQERLARAGA